jgi:hypothetical protein
MAEVEHRISIDDREGYGTHDMVAVLLFIFCIMDEQYILCYRLWNNPNRDHSDENG